MNTNLPYTQSFFHHQKLLLNATITSSRQYLSQYPPNICCIPWETALYFIFFTFFVSLTSFLSFSSYALYRVRFNVIYLQLQPLSTSTIIDLPGTVVHSPWSSTCPILVIVVIIFIVPTHHTRRLSAPSWRRTLPFNVCCVGWIVNSVFPQGIFQFLSNNNISMRTLRGKKKKEFPARMII